MHSTRSRATVRQNWKRNLAGLACIGVVLTATALLYQRNRMQHADSHRDTLTSELFLSIECALLEHGIPGSPIAAESADELIGKWIELRGSRMFKEEVLSLWTQKKDGWGRWFEVKRIEDRENSHLLMLRSYGSDGSPHSQDDITRQVMTLSSEFAEELTRPVIDDDGHEEHAPPVTEDNKDTEDNKRTTRT